jgi:hypothetical protein
MPGGIVIVQGSYSRSVSLSAGTHDGPGALDLKPADPNRRNTAGYKLLERIARQRGGAAWFRPWTNNYHVHVIVIGTPGLNSIARQQVSLYKAGRDGMVSNNRIAGVINTTFEKWKTSVGQIAQAVIKSVSTTARVNALQKAVRRPQTGRWDEQTDIDLRNTRSTAVEGYTGHYFNRWKPDQKKRMQKSWGAYQDGIWGFATKSQARAATVAIQRALGVTADGIWGRGTDAAYIALKAKTYKAPAKPVTFLSDIPVSLISPITVVNIRLGKKNTDIARYQAALWNVQSEANKKAWAAKWKITSRAQVFDGRYGPATADLTKNAYNWLAKNKPGQGWTAGATEPGAGLLRHIGFKSIR